MLQGYAAVNHYVPSLWDVASREIRDRGALASALPREQAQLALLCSMYGDAARDTGLRQVLAAAVAGVDWKADVKGAVQLLQAELVTT